MAIGKGFLFLLHQRLQLLSHAEYINPNKIIITWIKKHFGF
jgi:hypothetical protein